MIDPLVYEYAQAMVINIEINRRIKNIEINRRIKKYADCARYTPGFILLKVISAHAG